MKSGRPNGIFPRFSVAEDVRREIRAHLQMRAEELERDGWSKEEARREAERLFGDRESVARRCRAVARRHQRAVRRGDMMGAMWQDVRYGVRTLVASPAFTLVAIATLALGIGANTAIFSVVNSVLLQPLAFEDPGDLVWVREVRRDGGTMSAAWPNFRDWREESSSFSGLAAYGNTSVTILGGERAARGRFAAVSRDFFSVFRLQPLRGRLTAESDFDPGAPPVLIVTHGFWMNELGGKDLQGLELEVMGAQARVIGVIEDGKAFPEGTEFWGPVSFFGTSESRTSHNWRVVGRLAPGVPLEQANQELDALTSRIVLREADADPDFLAVGARVITLHEQLVGDSRTPLVLLLGAAALVLLVACTNLASTLLARGMNRETELAIRRSLGAGKGRIVRQLLTESFVLAGLGGAMGVWLAYLVVQALKATGPAAVPRLAEVSVDGWALVYAAGLAAATTLLFGLLPAKRLSAQDSSTLLKSGARGNAADRRGPIWRFLVGTEVALALVLLVGSGLLVRSFQQVLGEEAGFDANDVTTASISLSRLKYPDEVDHVLWYNRFLEEVGGLPGVGAVGVISSVPITGSPPNGRLELDGDLNKQAIGGYVLASAGTFAALDIPVIQGRVFDERDGIGDPHVAVVSKSFADKYWPGEDPLGKSVSGGGMDAYYAERPFSEVVGVVGDVRFGGLEREPEPTVYFSHAQRPSRMQYGATVVVEASSGDPTTLMGGLRATLQRLDSDVPVRISSYPTLVSTSLASRRFTMMLLGGFSMLALLLAGMGIYGVVSYTVARRTREMGIRMALGADAGSVVRIVVSASLRMVAGGLVVGVVASLGLTRVMTSLLYGVSPTDPVTLGVMVSVLAGVALLASWLPARVGTRVDPMITMRAE